MEYKLYSIYDEKTEIFNLPYASITELDALRTFDRISNDDNSLVFLYPVDYALYNVGSYNDQTGGYTNIIPPLFVTRAINMKRSNSLGDKNDEI